MDEFDRRLLNIDVQELTIFLILATFNLYFISKMITMTSQMIFDLYISLILSSILTVHISNITDKLHKDFVLDNHFDRNLSYKEKFLVNLIHLLCALVNSSICIIGAALIIVANAPQNSIFTNTSLSILGTFIIYSYNKIGTYLSKCIQEKIKYAANKFNLLCSIGMSHMNVNENNQSHNESREIYTKLVEHCENFGIDIDNTICNILLTPVQYPCLLSGRLYEYKNILNVCLTTGQDPFTREEFNENNLEIDLGILKTLNLNMINKIRYNNEHSQLINQKELLLFKFKPNIDASKNEELKTKLKPE